MREVKEDAILGNNEEKVSFKNTITGETIHAVVSTLTKPMIIKNTTYYQGMHVHVRTVDAMTSELELFNKYNNFEDEEELKSFILMPSKEGDLRVGFGKGCLLGGLDKELVFRQVSWDDYKKVGECTRKMYDVEKIQDEHNFLFGDGNRQEMDRARKMKWEVERYLTELTGWII